MGDVSTHRRIFTETLHALLPGGSERAYFELGNWLTDVSQFRDPYAHHAAKKRFWEEGRAIAGFKGRLLWLFDLFVQFDNYLDEVFGSREVTHGALARWCEDIIFVFTCAEFYSLARGPDDIFISSDDIYEIYYGPDGAGGAEGAFTQYYPHEHLDFPPWPHGDPVGADTRSRVSSRGRILAYLDDQLEYLADLFTLVERDWARAGEPTTDPARRQMRRQLARFGHGSHAVEDFFFHSNFVELAWEVLHPRPDLASPPGVPATPSAPAGAAPEDRPSPTNPTRLHRIFNRRILAPRASDGKLSRVEDAERAQHVYTGSFGASDVFHTFIDAIGPLMRPRPNDRPQVAGFRAHLRNLLTGDDQQRDEERRRHQSPTRQSEYRAMAAVLGPRAHEAMDRACRLDLEIAERYSRVPDPFGGRPPFGIVGILQELMAKARDETEGRRGSTATSPPSSTDGCPEGRGSYQISADLDAAGKVDDKRTDNCASGEVIGSHSLMAKDSIRKYPLRDQALDLAKHSAGHVVRTMAERRTGGPIAPDRFSEALDWRALLQNIVAHPQNAPGGAGNEWWRPLLATPPAAATASLGAPTIAGSDVVTRLRDQHRPPLEQRYNDLVPVVEGEYSSAVRWDWVLDTLVNGALLGGLALGATAGCIRAHVENKNGWAGAGIGVLVGSATGAVGGALLALLFSLANEHWGAVLGAFLGILGGGFGATYAIVGPILQQI